MSSLRTFLFGLMAVCFGSGALASEGLLQHVSTCVGRLSAQMEHHWLVQDRSTLDIERQREDLIDILEALTTSENASRVLSGRIDSKLAHSALLTRAVFGADPKTGAMAKRRVQQNLDACRDIALTAPSEETLRPFSTSDVLLPSETVNQSAFRVIDQD